MTKTLWKSMAADLKSGHDGSEWTLGSWRETKKIPSCCNSGFHASVRIIDAMRYTGMEILALVEVTGKSDKKKDKEAWSEMRVIQAYQWKKEDSVRMAIFAAELVIDIFEKEYPKDNRPREAIEAAKNYLKATNKKDARAARDAAWAARDAAWAAAWDAAGAARAAWAAGDAARDAAGAARDAARAAAGAAARAAAGAARAAAGAAARAAAGAARADEKILDECNQFVLDRIPTLKPWYPTHTPENIEYLRDNEIFVFGSNSEGDHAGGAAKLAVKNFGAVMGQGEGSQGQSYAVNTMSGLDEMGKQIKRLYAFAKKNPDKVFYVTKLGMGIAGYQVEDVKKYFPKLKPKNIILPKELV